MCDRLFDATRGSRIVRLGLGALCLSGPAWSQERFADLLLRDSLSFSVPKDFTPVAVVTNPDVRYQFAMKSKLVKAEIRYAIFPPIQSGSPAASWLETICLNLSGGTVCNIQRFPPQAVRTEFGANDGWTSVTPLHSEFGKGYAYCLINLIHKDHVADVVTFFLYDDIKVLQTLLVQDAVFHALKFR
jgi:hypothetical protein